MDDFSLPTRTLGPDGPPIGAIGLGCMGMSWAYNPEDRDDERSISVIRHALDIGVTLIDTADAYGPYTNEQLVGRALEGRRADMVLATKCGLEVRSVEPMEISRNGRPEHVRAAIDASLERLGTDHVDLYQLHRTDPEVPVAETWGAMAEIVAAGKARAIGMSEATVEELEAAQAVHPVATLQSELSLWERGPIDNGVLAWCSDHEAAFIPSRRWAGASSPARSRARRSPKVTCGARTHASQTMRWSRTSRSSTASVRWPSATTRCPARSRWRGCSPSTTASCRSPARGGSSA
jgi:aryl-alcohol dehydrogenase-like predicted oxidoreductase